MKNYKSYSNAYWEKKVLDEEALAEIEDVFGFNTEVRPVLAY